jgi:hypothetical protein
VIVASYPGLVRELINEALTEDEIRSLCFDHFRPVYNQLSAAMSRTECIRRLVKWCYERRQIESLLEYVKDLNSSIYTEYLPIIEQAEDKYPSEPAIESTIPHLYPSIIHPLPPAPSFIGRKVELDALHEFWSIGNPGVLALIGLGGAGKTAIVAEFTDRLLINTNNQLGGLLVWSFYVNQDVNQFLESAYLYFSGGRIVHGSGLGTFYLLIEILGRMTARNLIVMDGLEKIQRPRSDLSGQFGDITDPLLSQIVARMATGLGQTKCIITSRFPLPRLLPWFGKTYYALDIDQLQVEDARLLLRRHNVKGDDDALDDLIKDFGTHALTLDHLGGYLSEYCNGDPKLAKSLPEPQITSAEPQEHRLAKVLNAYEKALSERELAVLSRLCVFRFGTTAERLHSIFSRGDNPLIVGPLLKLSIKDFSDILKQLHHLHLVLTGPGKEYTAHPAIRDHFYRVFTDPQLVHQAVRHHYISLVGTPGTGLPRNNETVDLLEELLYHTLQSGNISEAKEIYAIRLGKYLHLAWDLGQYSRCVRILNEFPNCPDRAGLVWCYRALGDLDAARSFVDPDDTWWIGMLESLRGRLKVVIDLSAFNRRDPILIVSQFMTGAVDVKALGQIPIWFGLPISPAECYLHAGMVDKAKSFVESYISDLEDAQKEHSWNDEIARYDLINAEIELKSGNHAKCRGLLEKATQWIVQSGSQEHLCLLHLGKARLAIGEKQFELAESILSEGSHVAEQCGFGLYHIDLLNEQARLEILTNQYNEAVQSAQAALNGMLTTSRKPASRPDLAESELAVLGANHPCCQYVWGAAKAGLLYDLSVLLLDRTLDAQTQLESTLSLQRRIHHPNIAETERLLQDRSEETVSYVLGVL